MKLAKSTWLAAAAVALAFGTAHAADDPPGFNELDKDNDGALSRSEAAGNPNLAARFKDADGDGDGKVTRAEYLKVMAAKDFRKLREKTAEIIEPDSKKAQQAGARSGASAGASQQGMRQGGQQATSPELVRKVQQALNDKGHEAGPVDGIWGPRTQRGLRDFQKSEQGLEASGRIDAQTLSALGIEASATAGGSGQTRQRSPEKQDK